jgi:hypothetical protein
MATIQETLAQVRAKYGPTPTRDECGAICNETAFWHRNDPERWGVNQKTGGAFATRYDGQRIAADIIQSGATLIAYDCLIAAGDGGPATPAWQEVGVISDPARPWVAPITPQGDQPPPPPTECPCDAEFAALNQRLDDLTALFASIAPELAARLDELEALARVGRTFKFRMFGMNVNGSVDPVP